MKEQRLTAHPNNQGTLKTGNPDSERKEVLWIADIFQITPAGRDQLQKVAQQPAL